jgi:hypothetical protein
VQIHLSNHHVACTHRPAYQPRLVTVLFVFAVLLPSHLTWAPTRERTKVPRACQPEGRQSLDRVRATTLSYSDRRTHSGRNDHSRAALGPRSTAGRTSRPGRSGILSHRKSITNTLRPGYRTAEPSDSPPWASRYRSRGGAHLSRADRRTRSARCRRRWFAKIKRAIVVVQFL